ncbi:pyridoxal 5'-phosphate synthase [Leifsonia sp. NPDC058292]|uniref:pyridoxal 5'-phosphate synthase n=1 Tax=Leifsonia sp. NPDC058292 TaxID=3346428 RepID=UPI0036DD3DCC
MTDPHDPATLSGDETLDFPEFDAPPADPMPLLKGWLVQAQADGVREPLAASLATAGPGDPSNGAAVIPSVRTIAVKAFDERGLVFGSYTSSRKGRDLASGPYAAMGFYWRETMQQLRIEGSVERLGQEESAALFRDRPIEAQATAAASHQGEPLDDEDALAERAAALASRAEGIPMPSDWAGYRLVPTSIEFWHGRTSRLHRRLAYRRAAVGAPWTHARLQP